MTGVQTCALPIFIDGTGPGSTPQEPLALVAKMSDFERSVLDSEGRSGPSGLASAAEHDTTSPDIPYRTYIQHSLTFLLVTSLLEVYYMVYGINNEMPSKVAFDPKEPSLGRIWADSIAPPYSPATIKRCISRVERNPALAWPGYADLFADTSCRTPFKEGHISILRADGPGLSPNEPMAIVQVKTPSIPDGIYIIKNRAVDIFWYALYNKFYKRITAINFYASTIDSDSAKTNTSFQVNNHSPIIQVFKG